MQDTALLRISEEHVDLALVITDFLNFVTISLLITKWWQLSFPMRHLIYLVLIFPQHHPRLFLNTPPPALSQSHDFEAMSDAFWKRTWKYISQFGIKPKLNRDNLLLQAQLLSSSDEEIQALKIQHAEFLSHIETFPPGSKPLPQSLYGRDFNQVDKSDRRTMEVYGECKRRNWMLSCLIGLLSFQLIKCWIVAWRI